MPPKKVPPRIFGIVASRAPVAVVLRRGPSKLTQQLLWDLDTDVVTPGQWIKGHVFPRRCDLSPDGKLLVCAVSNYSSRQAERAEREYSVESYDASFWTAVSRPPYFTALALWFMGSSYNGGGMWLDDRTLGLNNQPYACTVAKGMGAGYGVRNLDLGPGEDRPLWPKLLERRGWKSRSEFTVRKGIWTTGARKKAFSNGEIRYTEGMSVAKFLWGATESWELCDNGGNSIRLWAKQHEGITWVDVDHRGRVLFGDHGKLFVWDDFPRGEPQSVADLSENKFESVAPPDWATRW